MYFSQNMENLISTLTKQTHTKKVAYINGTRSTLMKKGWNMGSDNVKQRILLGSVQSVQPSSTQQLLDKNFHHGQWLAY